MREKKEILRRIEELREGEAFWVKEVRSADDRIYRDYASGIIGNLRRELLILEWVLGKNVELPPAK